MDLFFFLPVCTKPSLPTSLVGKRRPNHFGKGLGQAWWLFLCLALLHGPLDWGEERMSAAPSWSRLQPLGHPAQILPSSLTCLSPLPAGHPQPKVTWFKDGRPLAGGDAHHISPDGAILRVLEANLSSAGHYSCIAANTVGEKTRHFQLSVLGMCWAAGHLQATLGAGGRENPVDQLLTHSFPQSTLLFFLPIFSSSTTITTTTTTK